MRKFYYIYGAIIIALIVLKILGLVGWWVVTAPIWFPIGVAIAISIILIITSDIGGWMKQRAEAKIKPSCDNCIFRQTQKLLNKEQCFGEEQEEPLTDGICKFYTRTRSKN